MKIMAMRRGDEEGFTLVELMIVVAIIGVLAALAIYGVSRYLKHSKTAEATRNLGSIETGGKNSYQQEMDFGGAGTGPYVHAFCQGGGTAVPAAPPKAAKYQSTASDWNTTTWQCLKFSINEPQFYAYNYTGGTGTGTGASYTAVASGDLDGNSTNSTFQLVGVGSQTGDAQRASFTITNEDE
jgi:type IV pilus assembly protein PilA